MQHILISGNIGRDAELRSTTGGDDVLSFNVGVRQGYKDDAPTAWYRCSLWGKRASALSQYLLKGVKVVVHGDLIIGSYDGKPQYDLRVAEVEFTSRAEQNQHRDEPRRGNGGTSRRQEPQRFDDLDDDVPFIVCDGAW